MLHVAGLFLFDARHVCFQQVTQVHIALATMIRLARVCTCQVPSGTCSSSVSQQPCLMHKQCCCAEERQTGFLLMAWVAALLSQLNKVKKLTVGELGLCCFLILRELFGMLSVSVDRICGKASPFHCRRS